MTEPRAKHMLPIYTSSKIGNNVRYSNQVRDKTLQDFWMESNSWLVKENPLPRKYILFPFDTFCRVRWEPHAYNYIDYVTGNISELQ